MHMNHMLAVAILIAATVSVAGCGGDEAVVAGYTVSKGQELTDLQRALEAGAIDQKEYEHLKKIVLKREQ